MRKSWIYLKISEAACYSCLSQILTSNIEEDEQKKRRSNCVFCAVGEQY